ncbi:MULTISPECIES: oxidoreductase [unclassified Streptomyces]|uniref:oxidoreductase n=1 Tax=unclassified Streptomyces TaxID=2593676 RepID=UPI000DB9B073|nr:MULTISPECIES: oxidoreductase [unclassified Streptomyces]MYT73155.1 SDR family NAD(P)-dependent oxidoreductase [Streptomyces sp. SID8367]RAJ73616.1 NAD(P)-dependent dehydrogenase (short-subunit alcohol dehydrogenase family) [Streptomyces sp. PsTaAH-137]
MTGWNARDIPDQSGRTAVVTGANSGIGYVTARELARAGAQVVLACRSAERGSTAVDRIRDEVPGAAVEFAALDLGDLASVRGFAEGWTGRPLDLLVNNAGVMALPYSRTADGFETQFGVNHLGHFALTGLLLPSLLEAPAPRVVAVSSALHALANIDIADLNSERSYRRWTAYARAKTANLLFVHELSRRATASGPLAVAAHPGYAATPLHARGARMEGRAALERLFETGNRLLAQPAEDGALPTLYAATARRVQPDDFYGPRLLMLRGAPSRSWRASWTVNDAAGERLWAASEQLTGVVYEGLKD